MRDEEKKVNDSTAKKGVDSASAKARPLSDDTKAKGGRPEDVGDGDRNQSIESDRGKD